MMIAIFNKKTCKSTRFNTFFFINSIIINIEIIQNGLFFFYLFLEIFKIIKMVSTVVIEEQKKIF